MNPAEAIAFVRRYNAWRRNDDESEMPHPKDIGQALEALCDHAERLDRELEQERQDRKQADLDTIRALGERNDARRIVETLRAVVTADHETKDEFIWRVNLTLNPEE